MEQTIFYCHNFEQTNKFIKAKRSKIYTNITTMKTPSNPSDFLEQKIVFLVKSENINVLHVNNM